MYSKTKVQRLSIIWNLLLLTIGGIVYVIGINAVVIHHNFITGGLYGLVLMVYYNTGLLSPGIWYLLMNIPLLILGWIFVSKRFLLYSVYCVGVITLASELLTINFGLSKQLYAAIAGGVLSGAGSGMILRSVGSSGGLDIVAVILNQKFNFGVGKTFMIFNGILFSLVISQYGADIFIASLILTYVSTRVIDYVLTLSNQRKIVYIISDKFDEISVDVMDQLKLGATFLQAKGAYSGKDKQILMTITNNFLLKRLEEAVFKIDEHALFIVENSYDVIGSSFRKRKIY